MGGFFLGLFIGFLIGWVAVALMFHAARDEAPPQYVADPGAPICGAQMELGEVCDLVPGHPGPHSHFLHW